MSIQIQRNGTWQEVSKQEFLGLVSTGVIRPDTAVIINDQQGVAARLKGLVFPSQQVAVPPPVKPEPLTAVSPGMTAQSGTGPFGRVLASGNGITSFSIFTNLAVALPIIVIILVVACDILPSKNRRRSTTNKKPPHAIIRYGRKGF